MPNVKERDNEQGTETSGSGDPDLQRETREAAVERVGEETYYREPDRFWTAQQGPLPESAAVAARGPQVYLQAQLPDPDIARAANFTPQEIPENLVINEGEALDHPRGPEPSEQVRLAKSDAVRRRVLDEAREKPDQAGLFTLTDHSSEEIRKAAETPLDHDADGHTHDQPKTTETSEPTKPEQTKTE